MKFSTKDYDLTPAELEDKYGSDEDDDAGQHPVYTHYRWREAVKCMLTLAGYWEWVHFELQCEMEDLERDNPFTRHLGDPS